MQPFVCYNSFDILIIMKVHTRTLLLFIALVLFVSAGGFFIQKGFFKYLEEYAKNELSAGNYLASVVAYNKLK